MKNVSWKQIVLLCVISVYIALCAIPVKAELATPLGTIAPVVHAAEAIKYETAQYLPEGKTHEDVKPKTETLITGEPIFKEADVRRMISEQERKDNLGLQNQPRFMGLMLGIFLLLLLGIKEAVEHRMQQDGIWTKVLIRALWLLAVVALVVVGFLLVLFNFALQ